MSKLYITQKPLRNDFFGEQVDFLVDEVFGLHELLGEQFGAKQGQDDVEDVLPPLPQDVAVEVGETEGSAGSHLAFLVPPERNGRQLFGL